MFRIFISYNNEHHDIVKRLAEDIAALSPEALRLRVARLDRDARAGLVSRVIGDCNAVAGARSEHSGTM